MKIRFSQLMFDKRFYPRKVVDQTHVSHIADAIEAGATLPPIVIAIHEKASVVIDGYHRAHAYKMLAGKEDPEIPATVEKYEDEAAMMLAAIRLNANHGRNLTPSDRVHCISIAKSFEIDDEAIADALNIAVEKVENFRQTRIVSIEGTRRKGILKFPVRHMAGETITRDQEEAIKHLPGNRQIFVVNTLIRLIESGLLDREDEKLMERLAHLKTLI